MFSLSRDPLYLPHTDKDGKKYVTYQVIGENNVAVPTHLFKIIFYPVQNPDGSDYSMNSEIYIVPNEDLNEETPLETFRTSLENFEKTSGILLPKGDAMKAYIRALNMPPPRM